MLNLYIHEIALHVDHNIDDFQPPYDEENLKPTRGNQELLNPAHLSAVTSCLSAIQSIIGIFLTYDADTVRVQPIFQFVRVAYAVVCLTKLYFAVTSPNSELGKVISRDDLKVEHNLDGLLETFRMAAEGDRCRPASKFLMILVMLKTWFQKQKGGGPRDTHPCGRMASHGAHTEDCCPVRRVYNELAKNDRGPAEKPKSVTGCPPNLSQGDEPTRAENSNHPAQRIEHNPVLSGYSNANTPLQLLSEVAMGDSNALVDAQAAAHMASGRLTNGGPTPSSSSAGWYGFNPQEATAPAPSIDYSTTEDLNPPSTGYGGPSDAEMEAMMGGGFGQALGLTLGDEDFPSVLLDDMFFSRLGDGSQANFFEGWG